MRYVPGWLPGGGWRKLADECKRNLELLRDTPHIFTKKQIVSAHNLCSTISILSVGSQEQGTAPTSVVSKILEEKQTPEFELEIKNVNVALVAGKYASTVYRIATLTLFVRQAQLIRYVPKVSTYAADR